MNTMIREKGFTLVELLVTIGIIAILAAIAIPNFITFRQRGYYAAQTSDAKNAYTAAQNFFNDYPINDITDLNELKDFGYVQTDEITMTIADGSQNSLELIISHNQSNRTYTMHQDGNMEY